MPSWECKKCGVANLPDDRECRACGRSRPDGWSDRTWECARCGRENRNSDEHCQQCGWRPGDSVEASVPRPAIRRFGIASPKDILADVRRANESLQAELRGPSAPPPVARPPVAQSPPVVQRDPGSFERATSRTLTLKVDALRKLNFALDHSGLPLIRRIELTNTDRAPANDVFIKAWVAPDYGESWQTTVPVIEGHSTHVIENVRIPLIKARMQEVREAERATLKWQVVSEGMDVQTPSQDLEVLAYNEWYYHPAFPQTSAVFVQPNSPAVERFVSKVRDHLAETTGDPSMDGYQRGDRARVIDVVKALYETLQQTLTYGSRPPSFEPSSALAGGGYTISQKVFFPEQILQESRGTCLDLAFLGASCLEKMGLHPLFFLVSGHAFFGAWLDVNVLRDGWTRDWDLVHKLIKSGAWLPINSTTFTQRPPVPFGQSRDEAMACLSRQEDLLAVVDIAAARRAGIKPIPPLVASA